MSTRYFKIPVEDAGKVFFFDAASVIADSKFDLVIFGKRLHFYIRSFRGIFDGIRQEIDQHP